MGGRSHHNNSGGCTILRCYKDGGTFTLGLALSTGNLTPIDEISLNGYNPPEIKQNQNL
jgi:hypothetical protein